MFVSVVHTRNIVEDIKNHHSTDCKCAKILGKSVFFDENKDSSEIDNDMEFVDLGLFTSVLQYNSICFALLLENYLQITIHVQLWKISDS